MVDQTSVDRGQTRSENGKGPSAAAGVRDGVGEVLYDIVSLGELQAQLLAVDARETIKQAQTPFLLLVVGAVLGVCAMPMLLVALAEALHELANWDRWLSYLTSGGCSIVVGGCLLALAWRQSAALQVVFVRSRAELAENVRWIKYALTRGRRPPR